MSKDKASTKKLKKLDKKVYKLLRKIESIGADKGEGSKSNDKKKREKNV